ncbi:hypothetical protein DXG03_000082 [Asterophora parasitica]|uniref:Uncharacterized protein n=1 Tax=Asterophora parasitica TaxID=117018 RepID=A0A9P7KHF0_9AGAR|nr:hypothetical protein DXG03_000082 [Asterophora parasitica]
MPCFTSFFTQGIPRDAAYAQATSPNVDLAVTSSLSTLHIQTDNLRALPPFDPQTPSPPLPLLPFIGERLAPTHLKVSQFGSKFLPHTKSQIRCLLPLESDRLLLIGHDEGLSVLDMFPQEWSDSGGITIKGPDEARARLIWQGERRLSLLEVENNGEGTPQGVILALVGPEPGSPGVRDCESMRSLRMYNLASISSLAKWTVAQKGARPLDLHRPSNWQVQQSPSKRTRNHSSIARSLKSFMDSPSASYSQQLSGSSSSYSDTLSPSPSLTSVPNHNTSNPTRLTPNRKTSDDSSWDVVDDLPLRWATDFVPLAANGSRLLNSSVLSYALWTNEGHKGKGGRLLAVATKNNILLYETPKGERAFHFVKDFYTPLQPRSISFFQQSVQEVGRSPWDVGTPRQLHTPHRRSNSSSTLRASSDSFLASTSSSFTTLNYGTHLSLFVVFEKKAGWIRLADSAVGEMELYIVGGSNTHRASDTSSTSSLRNKPGVARDVHLITRGKLTHILPSPLPVGVSSYPPLFVASWRSMIALSEHGVEVQEVPLSFLSKGKGKGKSRHSEDPLWAEEDFGGDVGFLCSGGHWDQSHHLFHRQRLSRSYSTTSTISANSFTSMESGDVLDKMKKEEGVYAWRREGLEDWRVFWIGGPLTGGPQDNIDADQ